MRIFNSKASQCPTPVLFKGQLQFNSKSYGLFFLILGFHLSSIISCDLGQLSNSF